MSPSTDAHPGGQRRCTLDFRVLDESRYTIFRRFYLALERWTQVRSGINVIRSTEETALPLPPLNTTADWLDTLFPRDLTALGLPDHNTATNLLLRWSDLSRAERRATLSDEPPHQRLAEFADMVAGLQSIDFTLVNCERIAADTARLSCVAPVLPLENGHILEDMLMFFGFFQILENTCGS